MEEITSLLSSLSSATKAINLFKKLLLKIELIILLTLKGRIRESVWLSLSKNSFISISVECLSFDKNSFINCNCEKETLESTIKV